MGYFMKSVEKFRIFSSTLIISTNKDNTYFNYLASNFIHRINAQLKKLVRKLVKTSYTKVHYNFMNTLSQPFTFIACSLHYHINYKKKNQKSFWHQILWDSKICELIFKLFQGFLADFVKTVSKHTRDHSCKLILARKEHYQFIVVKTKLKVALKHINSVGLL